MQADVKEALVKISLQLLIKDVLLEIKERTQAHELK